MVIIAVSMYNHWFVKGLLIVFGTLVLLCILHIYRIKSRFSEAIPVYGEIVCYRKLRSGKVVPTVKYETEDEIPVEKEYSVPQNVKMYLEGDSTVICYFPENFRLFYFKGHEFEFYSYYVKLAVAAAFVWGFLFILSMM